MINQCGRQMVVIVCDNISAGRRVVPLEVGGRPEKTSRSRSPRARETLAPDWYTYVTTWHFVNLDDCWHIRAVKSPAI